MLPTLIIFSGSDNPQLERRLRSLFAADEDIRFLPSDSSSQKAVDTDTLLEEIKQSYTQIMCDWDRLQFKQNTAGNTLLKELFFFFFTDFADSSQAEIFFKSIEFLKVILEETDFFPISFGGLLSIPEPLADSTRKAVFYQSLIRLNSHLRDSAMLRPRLLLLNKPVSASSRMDDFVQEIESILGMYIRNESMQAELDNYQRAGCQLRPLGKESPFSVLKWARLQFDVEKVFSFLCDQLVQKLINERLLCFEQPTDDEMKSRFGGYAERIRCIAKAAQQSWVGALDSDYSDSEEPELEQIRRKHLVPNQQNHDMLAELKAFDQYVLERYHQEINERKSFDNGLELLRYYVSLDKRESTDHAERQQNISFLNDLILEQLEKDHDIEQFLQNNIFPVPEISLKEPWRQHLPETLDLLRNWMNKSNSINKINLQYDSVNLTNCQAKFVLSLLETLVEWPIQPDRIDVALRTLTEDFSEAHRVIKQKKIEIENNSEKIQKEMNSLQDRGVMWKLLHAAEFNKSKKECQEELDMVAAELGDLEQRTRNLIEDMYSPWVRVGARWHFVLSQIALASDNLKRLADREAEQLLSLRNVASDAKKRCDQIIWLEEPPQIDLVCHKEAEKILCYDEQEQGDFYESWLEFPKDQQEFSKAPFIDMLHLSDFADGKMPVCISKLKVFATSRLDRYKIMDIAQIVGIIGEDRLRVLLKSTMDWLSPWMILDEGRIQALSSKQPISKILMESTSENCQMLMHKIADKTEPIQYVYADHPRMINLLQFTYGVPAFVLTGIAKDRLAWQEQHRYNDGDAGELTMDELIPEI